MTEICAIIPARSGSKGLPGKNIRLFGGHPLLAWSIAAAKLTPIINRVIVSTDSQTYADMAIQYGAEAPFLRPKELSTDAAQDYGFIEHALLWMLRNEGQIPDMLVHLRPTSPIRDYRVMEQAIQMLLANPNATSLCSAHEVKHPPCKYFTLSDDGFFTALMGEEYISLPRQECPKAYQGNGYIDILRPKHVLTCKNLYGQKRLAFIAPFCGDIDSLEEFESLSSRADSTNPVRKFLDSMARR